MPLSEDLLLQAVNLARMDPTRPRQANLRRSISASYYSLFHLLLADVVRLFGPNSPPGLANRVGRCLTHGEIKQVCTSVVGGNASQVLRGLVPQGFSGDLNAFAKIFLQVQGMRHGADYDLDATFTRTDALDLADEAQIGGDLWKGVRSSDEGRVFLSAALFAARWAR